MSEQLQRLEALLERVQQKRGATRSGAGTSPAAGQPTAAAAAAKPRAEVTTGRASSTSAAPRTKAAPTPLELALEGRASRVTPQPVPQPVVAAPPPAAAPAAARPAAAAPPARAVAQAAPAPAPARAAPAPVREGRLLAEPNVPEPTKPIAHVLSKQPPSAAATFGELLRRSLSLRPR